MKAFRFLLLALTLFLVSCDDSMKENIVERVQSVVAENMVSEETDIEEASEEIELLDNGCSYNEVYIENEQTCALMINCTDNDSCIEWGNQIVAELEEKYGSLVLEESVATGEEGITVLTTYEVDNEEEVLYTDSDVSDVEMEYHANLWFSFSWLIPEKNREKINRFEVFESGDTLAYLSLHDAHGEYWTLGMNNKQIELASETLVTYIHEYAHFLSLNQTQINYWQDESGCSSLYLMDSGCFYQDAYLVAFYRQFWETSGNGVLEDYFVSEYASSSPEEDFSESFAHFVLRQMPEGNSVAEEKLLYFYQYEELVHLRAEILARAATWLVRSIV